MANGQGGEWTIVAYERTRGDFPIRTFLAGLDDRNRERANALLNQLRTRGHQLREPHAKAVEPGLFELKSFQVRMFFMFQPGRVAVLLDGILKKQDKIAADDLKRVRAYKADVDRRGSRAS